MEEGVMVIKPLTLLRVEHMAIKPLMSLRVEHMAMADWDKEEMAMGTHIT